METVQTILEGGILVTLIFIGGVLVAIKRDTGTIAAASSPDPIPPKHGG